MEETIRPSQSRHLEKKHPKRFHHSCCQSQTLCGLHHKVADAVDPFENGEKICSVGRYTDIVYSHWSSAHSGSFSDGIRRKLHDVEI